MDSRPDRRHTMSFLKATWWRPATALAVLALAVLALSLTGTGTAHAGDPGAVTIDPAQKDIPVGGQGDVAIKIDPPAAGTSIWIVQVKYDPAVAASRLDSSTKTPSARRWARARASLSPQAATPRHPVTTARRTTRWLRLVAGSRTTMAPQGLHDPSRPPLHVQGLRRRRRQLTMCTSAFHYHCLHLDAWA